MGYYKELNQLVWDHSPLLVARKLAEAVAGIPEELHDTPRYRFLQAVLYYDAQHKATPSDWQGAAERFQFLPGADADAVPVQRFKDHANHFPAAVAVQLDARDRIGSADAENDFVVRLIAELAQK